MLLLLLELLLLLLLLQLLLLLLLLLLQLFLLLPLPCLDAQLRRQPAAAERGGADNGAARETVSRGGQLGRKGGQRRDESG